MGLVLNALTAASIVMIRTVQKPAINTIRNHLGTTKAIRGILILFSILVVKAMMLLVFRTRIDGEFQSFHTDYIVCGIYFWADSQIAESRGTFVANSYHGLWGQL